MDEATRAGMSPSRVQRTVGNGLWQRAHAGVYRLAGSPRSWEQDLMAACLWGRPGAVASHRAACRLLELGLDRETIVEIVLTKHMHSPPGVKKHTTDTLDPVDMTRVRDIPVTTASRTLIDLGAVAPRFIVESALETALRTQQTSIWHLIGRLNEIGKPGRRGTATIRAILRDRDPRLAPTESELETMLWRILVRSRLPLPQRQVIITDRAGRIGRVDFAYPQQRIVIEAQGARWHSSARAITRDMERRNRLMLSGWRVLEVSWEDVVRRPRAVTGRIATALRAPNVA